MTNEMTRRNTLIYYRPLDKSYIQTSKTRLETADAIFPSGRESSLPQVTLLFHRLYNTLEEEGENSFLYSRTPTFSFSKYKLRPT